jgi:hypothetical protein
VWRGAVPQSANQAGQITVSVAEPKPHGLEQGDLLFVFEEGEPNVVNPDQGSQYLGEFRVVQATESGVVLELVHGANMRTMPRMVTRLARSVQAKKPWSLYEQMPADNHEMFAGLSEEQLRQLIPAPSVDEYLRHGTPATEDDDEYHRAGYDEKKNRVGPDNADQAVEFRYDRTLRDYAYLFSEFMRERVVKLALHEALTEDVNRLKAALAAGKALTAYREKEKSLLAADLEHMKRDRQVIEGLLAQIRGQIETLRTRTAELLADNTRLAQQMAERQLSELRRIDETAPAPGLPAAVSAP